MVGLGIQQRSSSLGHLQFLAERDTGREYKNQSARTCARTDRFGEIQLFGALSAAVIADAWP